MDEELYTVVPCKNCDNVWIVSGVPDRTTCTLCNDTHQFKKLKKLYQTDDREEAREARALKQAQVNGVEHVYKALLENGEFDQDVMDSVVDEDYLRKKGIDPSIMEDDGISASSPKEKIRNIIEELDEPTEEAVLKEAIERGISEGKAESLIDKMCMNAEAMRNRDGTLRIL